MPTLSHVAHSMCHLAFLTYNSRRIRAEHWEAVSFVRKPEYALDFILAPPLRSDNMRRAIVASAPGACLAVEGCGTVLPLLLLLCSPGLTPPSIFFFLPFLPHTRPAPSVPPRNHPGAEDQPRCSSWCWPSSGRCSSSGRGCSPATEDRGRPSSQLGQRNLAHQRRCERRRGRAVPCRAALVHVEATLARRRGVSQAAEHTSAQLQPERLRRAAALWHREARFRSARLGQQARQSHRQRHGGRDGSLDERGQHVPGLSPALSPVRARHARSDIGFPKWLLFWGSWPLVRLTSVTPFTRRGGHGHV